MNITPDWPLLGGTQLPIDDAIDFAQIGFVPGQGVILVTEAAGKPSVNLMRPEVAAKLANELYTAVGHTGSDIVPPGTP